MNNNRTKTMKPHIKKIAMLLCAVCAVGTNAATDIVTITGRKVRDANSLTSSIMIAGRKQIILAADGNQITFEGMGWDEDTQRSYSQSTLNNWGRGLSYLSWNPLYISASDITISGPVNFNGELTMSLVTFNGSGNLPSPQGNAGRLRAQTTGTISRLYFCTGTDWRCLTP
jgi:hypothetical protein